MADETHARTMAFTTLMMFQLFNVYNCRSTWRSAFSGFFENKWLIAAVTLSLFTHVLVIYVPFLQAAIAKWWGPNGFTTTIHAMDVRVGGVWRFIMHGPDGTDYPNKIVYREIVKPERLVYDHGEDNDAHSSSFRSTVTFVAQGRKTKVTMRALFASAEARAATLKFGAIEGGEQTLARLDQHVATMSPVS